MKEVPKWVEEAAKHNAVSSFGNETDSDRGIGFQAFCEGARAVLERVEGTKRNDVSLTEEQANQTKNQDDAYCLGREAVRKEVLE